MGLSNCFNILLKIWSHLLKKSLMKNFIFCAVCYKSTLIASVNDSLRGAMQEKYILCYTCVSYLSKILKIPKQIYLVVDFLQKNWSYIRKIYSIKLPLSLTTKALIHSFFPMMHSINITLSLDGVTSWHNKLWKLPEKSHLAVLIYTVHLWAASKTVKYFALNVISFKTVALSNTFSETLEKRPNLPLFVGCKCQLFCSSHFRERETKY